LLEATIVLREILSRYRLLPDRWRPESHRFQHVTLVPSRGARISVIAHDRE
jgi:cytochrome P450 family 135